MVPLKLISFTSGLTAEIASISIMALLLNRMLYCTWEVVHKVCPTLSIESDVSSYSNFWKD